MYLGIFYKYNNLSPQIILLFSFSYSRFFFFFFCSVPVTVHWFSLVFFVLNAISHDKRKSESVGQCQTKQTERGVNRTLKKRRKKPDTVGQCQTEQERTSCVTVYMATLMGPQDY